MDVRLLGMSRWAGGFFSRVLGACHILLQQSVCCCYVFYFYFSPLVTSLLTIRLSTSPLRLSNGEEIGVNQRPPRRICSCVVFVLFLFLPHFGVERQNPKIKNSRRVLYHSISWFVHYSFALELGSFEGCRHCAFMV